MANLRVVDGASATKYLKASGAGSDADPNVVEHEVTQSAHDDLNANVNLQVANVDVGNANPVPISDGGSSVTVDGPLTDTQLRATAVPVSGTVTASGPLTDTQLRATAVPVSGPLTDTQLRATPVPVSGTVTATGALTDTELRATPVPVSGTVTASGPLTDTQLRATAVPVSGTVSVSAGTKIVSGSVTRPNDTTAYAANDAVTDSTSSPTAITFNGCAVANGGTGTIYSCQCIDSANQATKPQLELWVFAGTAAPTPDNDNATYTPTDAELANLVGIFEFNAWYVGDATSGAGGNCVARALNQNMGFDCGVSVDDLYGLVVVRNAYTPVAQEQFTFILHIGQD